MRGIVAFVPVVALVSAVAAASAHPAAGQTTPLGIPVAVEGTVAMAVEDDFQSGRATRHYFLDQSDSGRRYDLRLTPRQADIVQPGMRVRIIGRLTGDIPTADKADQSVVLLDPPGVVAPGKAR